MSDWNIDRGETVGPGSLKKFQHRVGCSGKGGFVGSLQF